MAQAPSALCPAPRTIGPSLPSTEPFPGRRAGRALARGLLLYGTAIIASLGILVLTLRLWHADLRVPLQYDGDAVLFQSLAKGVLDNDWYLHNRLLGMPGGMEMYDFPMGDGLHFLVIKLLGNLTDNATLVYNLYYLLCFPLTTLIALLVLRRLGVSAPVGLVMGLLFTFLPYHFMRGYAHYFLGAYYLVPLMVLLGLRLWQGCGPFRKGIATWPALAAAIVCLLVGSAGVYYAFFGCFFLLVGGAAGTLAARKPGPLVSGVALCALVSLSLGITLLPNFLYRLEHGPNPEAVNRPALVVEMLSLRITQLLLPVTGHRVPFLAKLKTAYNTRGTSLVTENDTATLGLVGAVGFLWLVGVLLLGRRRRDGTRLDDGLAAFNGAAVLLATMGGFGTILGLLATSWIRGYNRISVYIAFFCLAAVALLLDRFARRFVQTPRQRAAFALGLGLLLALGILDQTTPAFVPNYAGATEAFRADKIFVRQIEERVPRDAMIFQLPYVPYIEHIPPASLRPYDLLRPYLHSNHLRWSYGAMQGRATDRWQKTVAAESAEKMVRDVTAAGFSGIYLDRAGFEDQGKKLKHELTGLLGKPLVSPEGRRLFYRLKEPRLALSE